MARALISDPAANASMHARMRFDNGAYKPIAAPSIEEDVVNKPMRMTIVICANCPINLMYYKVWCPNTDPKIIEGSKDNTFKINHLKSPSENFKNNITYKSQYAGDNEICYGKNVLYSP